MGERLQKLVFFLVLGVIVGLTIIYRWYQPLTHHALLEFDIFDWARQTREWMTYGHILTPTSLWVFPVWNALVVKVTGLSIFSVYLYSGAVLTTLNLVILFAISSLLWKQPVLRLVPLLIYAFNTQLLPRSVNYLPETMSYTFGLVLVYFYLLLFKTKKIWWLGPIFIVNYFYFYLHQSGLNFLLFSAAAVGLYVLFLIPFQWRTRVLIFTALVSVGCAVLFGIPVIRQQFVYFLHGSSNADTAFQGSAIPFSQLFTDFNVSFFSLLMIGTIGVVIKFFRRGAVVKKITWGLLVLITAFYYCFLYVFPNFHIYNLVPWRFYTWFSLYATFVVAYGFTLVYHFFQKKMITQMVLLLAFIFFNFVHANIVSDDMYTADAATIQSMEKIQVPDNSIIITTNANLMQARFAFVGQPSSIVQEGATMFMADNASQANEIALRWGTGQPIYVLVSLYQLRQHPTQKAFWENSAIPNTRINNFTDPRYFQTIIHDKNILFVLARPK